MLHFESIRQAPLTKEPFNFFVAPHFLDAATLAQVNADYPDINEPRNYRIEELQPLGAFRELVERLNEREFEHAIGEKFGIDLAGKPKVITVRGFCEPSDGNIHTDSKTKLVTVLVYFNPEWPHEGGRLRLLRSDSDIEDYIAEVIPEKGTLLAFRRSDCSYHGHKPFDGPRRMLQLSWVEPKRVGNYKDKRSRLWWKFKRMLGLSSGGRFRTN